MKPNATLLLIDAHSDDFLPEVPNEFPLFRFPTNDTEIAMMMQDHHSFIKVSSAFLKTQLLDYQAGKVLMTATLQQNAFKFLCSSKQYKALPRSYLSSSGY